MSAGPQFNHEASRLYVISIRERLGFTQQAMADRLGMSLRAYHDVEGGASKCRPIHVLAAERISLQEAKLRENAELMAKPVAQEVRALAERGL